MKLLHILKIAFMIGLLGSLYSCKKDPGNYVYKELAEARVTNLQKIYTVFKGDKLIIKPDISYLNDDKSDTLNYKYEWLLIGLKSLETFKPILMGEGTTFRGVLPKDLGLYNAAFRIIDRRTGFWTEYPFELLIFNEIYEGWFVLSEIPNETSRLDMLSYSLADNSYNRLTDVLSIMKSPLKLEGKPNFIKFITPGYFFGIDVDESAQDRLAVGTEKTSATLGTNTLGYDKLADLDNIMPNGNTFNTINAKLQNSLNYSVMAYASNNVYYSTQGVSLKKVNILEGNTVPFKASPHVGFYDDNFILFDDENSEFLWSSYGSPCVKMGGEETLFPNKIDKDLMFIKYSTYFGGGYFAILKNKTDNKVFLARFTESTQIYFAELTGTMISDATHFEISDDFGYIFYSVGGKLYEYDFNTKTNIQMADYGNRSISLLKFETDFSSTEPRYLAIAKQLIVCTYNNSNLNTSGAIDFYNVPALNQELIKVGSSYTGFGKIVSLTYRSR